MGLLAQQSLQNPTRGHIEAVLDYELDWRINDAINDTESACNRGICLEQVSKIGRKLPDGLWSFSLEQCSHAALRSTRLQDEVAVGHRFDWTITMRLMM